MTNSVPSEITEQKEELKTVSQLLESFYKGKKLNRSVNKGFYKLEKDLTSEKISELIALALELDKDLNRTLSLAEFILGAAQRTPNHQLVMSFIEKVVSDYSVLSMIQTKTIFQTWVDKNVGLSDYLSFFADQLKNLKITDSSEQKQSLKEKQLNTILCIAAIWLYFNDHSDFTSLLRYLSKTAFYTKGVAGPGVEANAFAFASGMITSTKKVKFAYFLRQVSEKEETLSKTLNAKSVELSNTKMRLYESSNKNADLHSIIATKENEVTLLYQQIESLKTELSKRDEAAKHADIHHNDSKNELRVKVARTLEGELSEIIKKAIGAHSKSKHQIVEFQLNDALEVIEKELGWLRQ